MVWPSLISVSEAPGSYFFWAAAGPAQNANTRTAVTALRMIGMVSSRFCRLAWHVLNEEGTMTLVNYEQQGEIVTLTLNRPEKLNAFSDELVGALGEPLHSFDADETAHLAILCGNA